MTVTDRWGVAAALLALGAATRWPVLEPRSLWIDELVTLDMSRLSFFGTRDTPGILQAAMSDAGMGPLGYVLEGPLGHLVRPGREAWLRVPGYVASAALGPLCWLLLGGCGGRHRALAGLAGLLLATSALGLFTASSARGYSWALLCSMVQVAGLWRLAGCGGAGGGGRCLAAVGMAGLIGVLIHPLHMAQHLPCAALAAVLWWIGWRRNQTDGGGTAMGLGTQAGLAVLGLTVATALLFMLGLSGSMEVAGKGRHSGLDLAQVWGRMQAWFMAPVLGAGFGIWAQAAIGGAVAAAVAAGAMIRRVKTENIDTGHPTEPDKPTAQDGNSQRLLAGVPLAIWCMVILIAAQLALAGILSMRFFAHPRHTYGLVVPCAVLAAWALVEIWRRIGKAGNHAGQDENGNGSGGRGQAVVILGRGVLVAMVAAGVAWSALEGRRAARLPMRDWAGAMEFIAKKAAAEDRLVVATPNEMKLVRWYRRADGPEIAGPLFDPATATLDLTPLDTPANHEPGAHAHPITYLITVGRPNELGLGDKVHVLREFPGHAPVVVSRVPKP